ncbi:MAG TPA: hypothetical protein VK604_27630 [Bryobacteraceae bacterium]|nr:hypothetical protein [Bryobacteraceae bacterium]
MSWCVPGLAMTALAGGAFSRQESDAFATVTGNFSTPNTSNKDDGPVPTGPFARESTTYARDFHISALSALTSPDV